MSGAEGAAGGTGADGGQPMPAALPDAVGGAPGPRTDNGPHQGGITVTDTRPAQQHQHAVQQQTYGGAPGAPVAEQPQAQQLPQGPHQPPQAYAPPAGPPAVAGVRQPRPAARTVPRTRKARLRVAKADPWSVMKVSFLLSIALGICTVIAVAVLWMVMDAIGVFTTVGGTLSEATSSGSDGGFDLVSFLSLSRVLTFTAIIAVIDVVLATALATLGAFIYNMSAGMVGGIELTLAEDE
ncbi:DUF3566 domain-containing protein [Streptomyces sp. ME01-24h]|nr:DUF3566 domain-containing protein [Streptomyces sp. ME19-03-3]MDX3214823.1 DUF3566 domain-containing protein [Streptomyces sp. ME02-6991-2B]MDX3352116.1 DUF3566 domain-containing protein [Streptomyces sp. ME01-24h]